LYEGNMMPFGMKNATNTFSHIMVDTFKKWTGQFLKVFVDNINIHSNTWVEHLHHIRLVPYKLVEVNFKLNPRKCCFGYKNITF
jgi:pentose-5-phosphate-3-epimerase